MKWGILFRWGSWWIGGHWSDHNKRLCVNPVPMVTIWITAEGGETPDSGYGFDIYRSDKHQPKKVNGWPFRGVALPRLPANDVQRIRTVVELAIKHDLSLEDFRELVDMVLSSNADRKA